MNEPVIRKMAETDLPGVLKIERETFRDAWTLEGFLDALHLDYACFLVAEADGEIAGYCCLYQSFEEAEMVNVAVAQPFRRKGIARCMLRELIRQNASDGVRRFLLEVRESNEPAIRLYQSLGFARIAVQKNFYTLPREDAILMELTV